MSSLVLQSYKGCPYLIALAILLLSSTAASKPLAPEGTFVRISIEGGVSPFSKISYDLTVRGPIIVATIVKESLCYKGQQDKLRLIDGVPAQELIAALSKIKAFDPDILQGAVVGKTRDNALPKDQPRYEFWSAWGQEMTRFSVLESQLREAEHLSAIFSAVRSAVVAQTGSLPMRDLFHPTEKLGYLTMTATESATATIDGWDSFKLPVDGLEVVEGYHKIVVVGESGVTREFNIRIVAGGSNQIHVLLDERE